MIQWICVSTLLISNKYTVIRNSSDCYNPILRALQSGGNEIRPREVAAIPRYCVRGIREDRHREEAKHWLYGVAKKKFNCPPWVLKVRQIVISPWTPGHESDFKIDVARKPQVPAPATVKVLFGILRLLHQSLETIYFAVRPGDGWYTTHAEKYKEREKERAGEEALSWALLLKNSKLGNFPGKTVETLVMCTCGFPFAFQSCKRDDTRENIILLCAYRFFNCWTMTLSC